MSAERVEIGGGRAVLYLGDCRDVLPTLSGIDAVVTDPPYGISYSSGMTGHHGGTSLPGIIGDADTSLRDFVVEWSRFRPAIVFGTWKRARPTETKAVLIWEKGDHVGMGDLSLPWKPNTEEIYVLGAGFSGHRGSSVIRVNAPVSWNSVGFGRKHPHEKPVELMLELVAKCPPGTILDPFMGSASTGVAALSLGRRFVGIELDPAHFETACRRIEAACDDGLFAAPEPPARTADLFEPLTRPAPDGGKGC